MFQSALEREEYLFILDNCTYYLEPDSPDYQKYVGMTYLKIDSNSQYDILKSTRHFGPMCFYLTWHNLCDNILIYFIDNKMISEAIDIVSLYHSLHKDSKGISVCDDSSNEINYLQAYIDNDSLQKTQADLALKSYIEYVEKQKEHSENIEKMHGRK